MDAIRKADAAKQKLYTSAEEMRPGPEAYLERPIREDSASQGLDMDEVPRVKGRAANVSDFKKSIKEREVDAVESMDMREQAVWSNPWNMGKQKNQSEARTDAGPRCVEVP